MIETLTILLIFTTALVVWLASKVNTLRDKYVEMRNDERERIFDLSLDMMCVSGFDGSVKLANPQFSSTLGWSPQEILTDDFLSLVHTDDRELTMAGMARAMAGEPLTDFRNRCLCKDGTFKLLAWKVTPDVERGLFYCAARDVTEDDQLVRSFVENIDQVVWVTDVEAGGRVLYVSPAYERVWGRPCASLYDNPHGWIEAIHSDDRSRVEAAWALQRTTGVFQQEYRVVRPDGTVRWIRDRGVPLRNAAGDVTRMIGLADDITDYKATAERLQHTERLASIGTLAAGIAHEINNPIGGIQLAAQAALNAKSREAQELALADILREAERCGRIVDNVLTFAREAVSEKHLADFNDVVRRAAALARGRVEPHGVKLELSCAEQLPKIELNETELEQAICNLIQNACEARAHIVSLQTAHADGYVRLTVEDDGVGLTPEHKLRVFEPFYTTRRGRGGTGLGLSITHGIVEDHAGTIDVESVRGLGTKMILNFPVSRAHRYEEGRDGQGAGS